MKHSTGLIKRISDRRAKRPQPGRNSARAVIYDDGKLIAPDALREHGVTVTKDEDGVLEYRDAPPALSLSACHLAIDLREDPAAFLIPDVE